MCIIARGCAIPRNPKDPGGTRRLNQKTESEEKKTTSPPLESLCGPCRPKAAISNPEIISNGHSSKMGAHQHEEEKDGNLKMVITSISPESDDVWDAVNESQRIRLFKRLGLDYTSQVDQNYLRLICEVGLIDLELVENCDLWNEEPERNRSSSCIHRILRFKNYIFRKLSHLLAIVRRGKNISRTKYH